MLYELLFICASLSFLAILGFRSACGGMLRKLLTDENLRLRKMLDLLGWKIGEVQKVFLLFIGPVARVLLNVLRIRREREIEDQLPDALALIGNAIKAGLAVSQALKMASVELEPPLGYELSLVSEKISKGYPIEAALSLLSERVRSMDIELFVQSVSILRRSGGNIVEVLGHLAKTIEERRRIAGKIKAVTAQGRFQGSMLLAMPWALGLMLWIIAPDYIEPLINARLGRALISLGILMEGAGALWMRKIVSIKV